MPDVSVVMPLYNPDLSRIQKSLDSCTQQACSVEVVIVNDGSIFDFKPATRPDFVVLNRAHRGLVPAVNAGIEAATGDYIITLADDTFVPNALYKLHQSLIACADPVSTFAYGNIQLPDRLVVNKPWRSHKPGDGLRTSAAIMWHRSHFPDCQFWQPEGMAFYAEDYDFVLQLEAAGVKGLHVNTIVMNHIPGAQSAGVQENRTAIREVLARRHAELNA